MTTAPEPRSIPLAPDIFTWPSASPQLIGGRCAQCEAVTFPNQFSCPRCGAVEMEERLLPRRGVLWAWTTQGFLPKEPYAGGETEETFKPYGVGVVELGGEVRVEGRLTEADPDRLIIGAPYELVIIPLRSDADAEVLTYAFQPVTQENSDA